MRRTARISVITILLVFIILIVVKIAKEKAKKNEIYKQVNFMPEFDFQYLDNTGMKNNNIDYDETLIINYFNTRCDFCCHEIKDIISHEHLFSKSYFLLVSGQHADTLIAFNKALNIDSFPSINICKVDYLDFIEKFGDVVPPTTFVYDSNKRLIKKYKGQIRAPVVADDIKKYYTKINEEFR